MTLDQILTATNDDLYWAYIAASYRAMQFENPNKSDDAIFREKSFAELMERGYFIRATVGNPVPAGALS